MKHGSLYHLALSVKDRTLPERYLGRQIGKYQVTRLLGGGAFAWVYEAVDRDLEIPVALKILRPEFAGQSDAETRFRREAATAARLRHPNIVTVRDVGQVDGASFVAMDLLPLSLARRLELLNRLSEADTVRIGLDVAAALAVAHAGGIVHRDIKPDNILIGTRGEAVVADFGLARTLDADAARSSGQQVMGTPHYFSPEQARGIELDGRSDLYSLGVTLFRSATGRLPFEGDDWYGVARQHVDAPPPSPREFAPELSEEFERVVLRLLSKSPEDRYASALLLADALAALPTAPPPSSPTSSSRGVVTETVTAFAPVNTSNASPAVRRARWPVPVASVALIGVAAWFAWQQPGVQGFIERGMATSPSPSTTPATLTTLDTNALSPRDSGTRSDSAPVVVAPVATTVAPRPTDTVRRQAAANVRSKLVLSAPDSAVLYVDGVVVGHGSATITRPGATRLVARAVIASAPINCETARHEETVQLAVGEQRALKLNVRTCLPVRITVKPVDTRIRFESLDGGETVDVPADGPSSTILPDGFVRTSVLLPAGRYELKAQAPRCQPYSGDTIIVGRGVSDASLSRTIKMPC